MAAITSVNVAPVMAKATVEAKAQRTVAAPKACSLKAASLFSKTESSKFVSNGFNTSAMMVWTPNNNKFFETFSYLPPLSDEDIAKQVAFMVSKGYTPCLEFAEEEVALTVDHGTSQLDSRTFAGYYDNRYWTMWKLPMFGCQDPGQVLGEIARCCTAFPNSYVRVCGFDATRQVQTVSFLVQRPVPAIPTHERSV
mmetsp:Transcript_22840/g.27616  ORF Transcript_22840/g.27616 Transcript_22840/m.27616 type:complete len:196 (+) Transcript_22840:87-674(+)|eukprot:CAMPEP_0197853918 /NCGR_PEP_ID=MMETSP1438-20131217/23673_1 /TAXON_ID=1461541 /ORGANISM="Pterosperma sp., Strain CCMP1384" /LENGTH=195 /DNA_ID=CAMNT_0043468493 /DNA_START=86 /DNA_END=673 /DNA_ORIENTATION=-